MYARIVFSAIPAVVVTLALYFLMMSLITTANKKLNDDGERYVVDFVRVQQDEAVQTKDRKPEKPPQPEESPPDTVEPQLDAPDMQQNTVSVATAAPMDKTLDISTGFGLSGADGDFLPIVKVQPIYPRRALSRGIEGYVILEFTVTKNGSVKDPVVVEANPTGIFDSAAINAALKFKYKPRIVDGVPVDVAGVQNQLTFQLED
ncbi:MAG: TonB family protein [Ketobacter sp.]